MAQYQITISDEVLHQLFARDDAPAGLVEQVLNQVLQAQVAEHLQAGRYQRTETRQGYRNGFRPRTLKTRVGKLKLKVPKYVPATFLYSCLHVTSAANKPLQEARSHRDRLERARAQQQGIPICNRRCYLHQGPQGWSRGVLECPHCRRHQC